MPFRRQEVQLSSGETAFGPPVASADAWLLSLEGQWLSCRLSAGSAIWVTDAARPIIGGMSGSPIITRNGAVGVICFGDREAVGDRNESGPNPYLPFALPGWMLYEG
jgi:hypothetical protein